MSERDELLWIGSFRYHLGRCTYAVGQFCEALISEWPNMPARARMVIRRELGHAVALHAEGNRPDILGHDCDAEEWKRVWRYIDGSTV